MDHDEDQLTKGHVSPECHDVSEAEIDSALEESFPASDPLPWTLGAVPCVATTTKDNEESEVKRNKVKTE
jgi:hypothetical protein